MFISRKQFYQVVVGFLLCLAGHCSYAIDQIHITVDSINSPQIDAQSISVDLDLNQTPQLKFKTQYRLGKRVAWADASAQCTASTQGQINVIQCPKGLFKSKLYNVPFSLVLQSLSPEKQGLKGKIELNSVQFSDKVGLHAGENIEASIAFTLQSLGQQWQLDHALDWRAGEVYWDPFYIKGEGHQLKGRLAFKDNFLTLSDTQLWLHSVGLLKFNGEVDLRQKQVSHLEAELPDLNLANAFPLLFKPMLQNSALQHTDLSGLAALQANIKDNELKSFNLSLKDVSVRDTQQHFAFEHINAQIPWDYDAVKSVTIQYQNGQLRGLPLGPANVEMQVNRYAWTANQIKMPILDGAMIIKDLSAARFSGRWHWHLGAEIQNLGMPQLSKAFGWPEMQGQASVNIPLVTYSNNRLNTDGEVIFKVFDGETKITQLAFEDPLGNAPKLYGSVQMRALDLGKLTKTFSFGSIEGRLDGDVNELALQNWQPVAFDARFVSSPGQYRKKISQRAVENISALGGAGAVAAIQRSVLRFFQAFNYDKIGLSCRLRHNVCEMGGLTQPNDTSTNQGYVIVKGKGIPAISVKGFNRTVGWDELLNRIKRITNENTEAVIQ